MNKPAKIYQFKVNSRNTRKICSKLTIKTPVNWATENIKILGLNFLYAAKLKEVLEVCDVVANIKRMLKLQKSSNLTLKGKLFMFKLLAFSEIIFQELKLTLPKQTYQSDRRKQKMISSRNRKCNDFK